MKTNEARALFVGANDKIFLDSACVGLAPTTARTAIAKFLDLVVECPSKDISDHHIAMDDMKSEATLQASLLLNTDVDNVSLIESTTHGLNIAANSIPFVPSDEIIICDTEYLQVAIPFVKKHAAGKLKLVPLKSPKTGFFVIDDFERALTKNTKAICLSSVQWCTGQKIFTKELGDLCQSKGIWLIVDGVQEAGALDVDATLRYCDFYVAGGHKWLNAPYGCGLMYMSKRAQALEPPSYGYLNLPAPSQGWGKFFQMPTQTPFRDYIFPNVAKSFGIGGTGNYPGAIGLAESIKIVNHIGPKTVQARVLELTGFLRDELRNLGARVLSPNDLKDGSGITIFRVFDSPEKDLKVLENLLSNRIFLSVRYTNGHGGIRASAHYFNNEEDILRLSHALRILM